MLKIENTEVFGWDAAIRGMRNPKNSWDKSDSYWTHIENPETLNTAAFQFFMGENDLKLARTLANAGSDHGKFLRMIHVQFDCTAPLYWWKEYDTYKVGTVADSCSTMHKLTYKEFEISDFSHEHLEGRSLNTLEDIVDELNHWRDKYLVAVKTEPETGLSAKDIWWQLIQLLPSSYNQRRTLDVNYAVLKAMYHARKNHKLDEWHTFCDWIETLPCSELITGGSNG